MDAALAALLAKAATEHALPLEGLHALTAALAAVSIPDLQYCVTDDAELVVHAAEAVTVFSGLQRKRVLKNLQSTLLGSVPAAAAADAAGTSSVAAGSAFASTAAAAPAAAEDDDDVLVRAAALGPVRVKMYNATLAMHVGQQQDALTPALAMLVRLMHFVAGYRPGAWEDLLDATAELRTACHRYAATPSELAAAERKWWNAQRQMPLFGVHRGVWTASDLLLLTRKSRVIAGVLKLPPLWSSVAMLQGVPAVAHIAGRPPAKHLDAGGLQVQHAPTELGDWDAADLAKCVYMSVPRHLHVREDSSSGSVTTATLRATFNTRTGLPDVSHVRLLNASDGLLAMVPDEVEPAPVPCVDGAALPLALEPALRTFIEQRTHLLAHRSSWLGGVVPLERVHTALRNALEVGDTLVTHLNSWSQLLACTAETFRADGRPKVALTLECEAAAAAEGSRFATEAVAACNRALQPLPARTYLTAFTRLLDMTSNLRDGVLTIAILPPLRPRGVLADATDLSMLAMLPLTAVLDFEGAMYSALQTHPCEAESRRTVLAPVRKDASGMSAMRTIQEEQRKLGSLQAVRVHMHIHMPPHAAAPAVLESLGDAMKAIAAEANATTRRLVRVLYLGYGIYGMGGVHKQDARERAYDGNALYPRLVQRALEALAGTAEGGVEILHLTDTRAMYDLGDVLLEGEDRVVRGDTAVALPYGPVTRLLLPLPALLTTLQQTLLADRSITSSGLLVPLHIGRLGDFAQGRPAATRLAELKAAGLLLMHRSWAGEAVDDVNALQMLRMEFAKGGVSVPPALLATPDGISDIHRTVRGQLTDMIMEAHRFAADDRDGSVRLRVIDVLHEPLCGASTAVWRVLHDLRERVPTLVLLQAGEASGDQAQLLADVHALTGTPVVLFADNTSDQQLRAFTDIVQDLHLRVVLVHLHARSTLPDLSRSSVPDASTSSVATSGGSKSPVLINVPSKADADALSRWRHAVFPARGNSGTSAAMPENDAVSPADVGLAVEADATTTSSSVAAEWEAAFGIDILIDRARHSGDMTGVDRVWRTWAPRVRAVLAPLKALEDEDIIIARMLRSLAIVALVRAYAPRLSLPAGVLTQHMLSGIAGEMPAHSQLQQNVAAALEVSAPAAADSAARYFEELRASSEGGSAAGTATGPPGIAARVHEARAAEVAADRAAVLHAVIATPPGVPESLARITLAPDARNVLDVMSVIAARAGDARGSEISKLLVTLDDGSVTVVHPLLATIMLSELLYATDAAYSSSSTLLSSWPPRALPWLVLYFLLRWVEHARQANLNSAGSAAVVVQSLERIEQELLFVRVDDGVSSSRSEFSPLVSLLLHPRIDAASSSLVSADDAANMIACFRRAKFASNMLNVACVRTFAGMVLLAAHALQTRHAYASLHLLRYIVKRLHAADAVALPSTTSTASLQRWHLPLELMTDEDALTLLTATQYTVNPDSLATAWDEMEIAAHLAQHLHECAQLTALDLLQRAHCCDTVARFWLMYMRWTFDSAKDAYASLLRTHSRIAVDAPALGSQSDPPFQDRVRRHRMHPVTCLAQLLQRLASVWAWVQSALSQERHLDPESLYAVANEADATLRLLNFVIAAARDTAGEPLRGIPDVLMKAQSSSGSTAATWRVALAHTDLLALEHNAYSVIEYGMDLVHQRRRRGPAAARAPDNTEVQLVELHDKLTRLRGDEQSMDAAGAALIAAAEGRADTAALVARIRGTLLVLDAKFAAARARCGSTAVAFKWCDTDALHDMVQRDAAGLLLCARQLMSVGAARFFDDLAMRTCWHLLSWLPREHCLLEGDLMQLLQSWELVGASPSSTVGARTDGQQSFYVLSVALFLRRMSLELHLLRRRAAGFSDPVGITRDEYGSILVQWDGTNKRLCHLRDMLRADERGSASERDVNSRALDAQLFMLESSPVRRRRPAFAARRIVDVIVSADGLVKDTWVCPSVACVRRQAPGMPISQMALIVLQVKSVHPSAMHSSSVSGHASISDDLGMYFCTDQLYDAAVNHAKALERVDAVLHALLAPIVAGANVIAYVGFSRIGPRANVLCHAPDKQPGNVLSAAEAATIVALLTSAGDNTRAAHATLNHRHLRSNPPTNPAANMSVGVSSAGAASGAIVTPAQLATVDATPAKVVATLSRPTRASGVLDAAFSASGAPVARTATAGFASVVTTAMTTAASGSAAGTPVSRSKHPGIGCVTIHGVLGYCRVQSISKKLPDDVWLLCGEGDLGPAGYAAFLKYHGTPAQRSGLVSVSCNINCVRTSCHDDKLSTMTKAEVRATLKRWGTAEPKTVLEFWYTHEVGKRVTIHGVWPAEAPWECDAACLRTS